MNVWTVKEISTRVGVSPGAIYKAVAQGSLRHYRIGAAIRISEEHFQAWLAEIEQATKEPAGDQSFSHLDL